MEEDVSKEVCNFIALDWRTGLGVTLLTSDLFGHLFKVAFSAQFFKAELDGSAEQQLFTVHALLLRLSWFRLLLLLQPLQRRFLSAGFSEWQDSVHCWVDLTRCPNKGDKARWKAWDKIKDNSINNCICRLWWSLTLLEAHLTPPQMAERLVWKVAGP